MCHGTPLVFLCLAGCFRPLFSTFLGGGNFEQQGATKTSEQYWLHNTPVVSENFSFGDFLNSQKVYFQVIQRESWRCVDPNCGTLKIHWFLKGTSTISGTEKTWVILRHTHTHVVGILGEFASHDPKPLHTGNPPHKMPSGTSWNTIDWKKIRTNCYIRTSNPYENLNVF